MKFNSRFTSFFGGAAISSLVPQVFMVSLNGRGYLVDDTVNMVSSRNGFRQQTIQLLRNQADNSSVPSEASMSPEDLWRRSHESWHHGAGQTNFDRPESDPVRFRSSKGINVWTRYEMSLLSDTANVLSSANTNLHGVSVGSRFYVSDGTALKYSTDLSAWSTVTTTATQAITSVASDGFNVWAARGSDGVWTTTRTGTTETQYVTTGITAGVVGFVKGRLMVASANVVYNVTASGALPTALYTHPNSDYVWVAFAEGPKYLYAAGYSGDKSEVWKSTLKADGTSLDVMSQAAVLPDGEIVRAIEGYLGYVAIGTDKGVRFAEPDADGNLTLGALIPTTSAVQCFEPQDRFMWYGLTNYDSTSTGLGRMDLSTFTDALTPAYASDLMAVTQGAVLSAATFGGVRVFTVSGHGVYHESTSKVASGTLDSGLITYGIAEEKIAMSLDVKHLPLNYGSHVSYISPDSASFRLVGTHSVGDPEVRFSVGQLQGETFEIRTELDRSATDTTRGPTITRWTLRAEPAPARSLQFTVPLLFEEQYHCLDGQERRFDVEAALDDIQALAQSSALTAFQVGSDSYTVMVKDYDFLRQKPTMDGKSWQGTCTVLLKAPAI